MNNPFKDLTKNEWIIWISSLALILAANVISGNIDILTLTATCLGATSLVFAAKGNAWSQILMIIFSILYSLISFRMNYWGEMITYLGMTMPMAIWSTITWLKNPAKNGKEVKIQKLTGRHISFLALSCIIITPLFWYILRMLDTPNMLFSAISITTSFLAAALTMLRSSYYAIAYAANDLILIVLWSLAALDNSIYIPVVVNFIVFFFNDMYGFFNWRKRELLQV